MKFSLRSIGYGICHCTKITNGQYLTKQCIGPVKATLCTIFGDQNPGDGPKFNKSYSIGSIEIQSTNGQYHTKQCIGPVKGTLCTIFGDQNPGGGMVQNSISYSIGSIEPCL